MLTQALLFAANPKGRNLVFNFRHHSSGEFDTYARAFHQAGKLLTQQLLESSPAVNDLDGMPIVMLYRHALELYLKALICIGNQELLRVSKQPVETEQALQEHQLQPLATLVQQVFQRLKLPFNPWNFEQEGLRSYEEFQALIAAWEILDEGSFRFRDSSVGVPPQPFAFYLPSFCDRMDVVLQQLEAMATGLRERPGKGKLNGQSPTKSLPATTK